MPKPRVLPEREVISAGNGKSGHETFAAPKRRMRVVPWGSNLLTELQRERKERLFALVDPLHMLQCEQVGYNAEQSVDKCIKFWSKWPHPVERPIDGVLGCCQMPLAKSTSCRDCVLLGTMYNCPKHMMQCRAPVRLCCANNKCLRFLCWEHMQCEWDSRAERCCGKKKSASESERRRLEKVKTGKKSKTKNQKTEKKKPKQ